MTEKQAHGELLVNGNFAIGDFSGWMSWTPEDMAIVPQEGKNIAVLAPVPYGAKVVLRQLIDRESSDGAYVVGYWLRTSDKQGDAVRGVTRKATINLVIHPTDGGLGQFYILSTVATSSWVKHVFRFWIEGRANQQFELYFKNEKLQPQDAAAPPAEMDNYTTVSLSDDGPDLATPNDDDDDNCAFALRDAVLFKFPPA
ncbi:hypothetical protein [Pandoraea sp. PE-S2T-3]|uniref:hypothetical protein n=1 Tax=Pandoraea sp. PE-S2T-3 TaxID=1986993 RepID=UPI001124E1F8|nr:hypothetical protein [Pandoraea sp. PE-S2T-3]